LYLYQCYITKIRIKNEFLIHIRIILCQYSKYKKVDYSRGHFHRQVEKAQDRHVIVTASIKLLSFILNS
jgi:hypothetical protein